MSNADPHTEPENSTVEDWMGQEVNKDMDLAEELVEKSGGDLDRAEQEFADRSAGAEPDEGNVPRAGGDGHS